MTGLIRTGFTLSLILSGAWMLFESGSLSRPAMTIPVVVILGTLVLLVIQFLGDLIAIRVNGPDAHSHELLKEPSAEPPADRVRFFFAVAWLSLFAALIWSLGLVAGSALFCMAFLRGHTREGWVYSIIYALAVALSVSGLFLLLGVPAYGGVAAEFMS